MFMVGCQGGFVEFLMTISVDLMIYLTNYACDLIRYMASWYFLVLIWGLTYVVF